MGFWIKNTHIGAQAHSWPHTENNRNAVFRDAHRLLKFPPWQPAFSNLSLRFFILISQSHMSHMLFFGLLHFLFPFVTHTLGYRLSLLRNRHCLLYKLTDIHYPLCLYRVCVCFMLLAHSTQYLYDTPYVGMWRDGLFSILESSA